MTNLFSSICMRLRILVAQHEWRSIETSHVECPPALNDSDGEMTFFPEIKQNKSATALQLT
jgi:hypothetical protein